MSRRPEPYLPGLDPAPLMVLPPQTRAPEKPVLDLPDDEMAALCRALNPARVSFFMCGSARRIAESICKAEPSKLSRRQRNAAIRVGWRYRRQLPIPVRITLARFRPADFK